MNASEVPDLNLPCPGNEKSPPSPRLSDDAYAQWTEYEWRSVVDVKKARANARLLRVHHGFAISSQGGRWPQPNPPEAATGPVEGASRK